MLIHGLATNRHIWVAVIPELARTRCVVTLDVPGFGESEAVGEGFGLAAVAERIARGLAARGVRTPFDVVGHSLGAGVALTLACRRPRSVRRLLLVAPAGLAPTPWFVSMALAAGVDGLLAGRRRLAPLADLRLGRRLLLGFAAADGANVPPSLARQMVLASAGAQRTSSALREITTTDVRSMLAGTTLPLGVIWGAKDRVVSVRQAESVRAARPDAGLEIIDGAGHVPMIERPEAFVVAVDRLLHVLPKDATSSAGRASNLR